MNKTTTCKLLGAALVASGLLATSAQAAPIFTDGFDAATGNQNGSQDTTTLALQFNANYVNWGILGSSGHQVDLNTANAGSTGGPYPNPSNWAAMLLLNQVLTSNANIAANTNGQEYTVDFLAGAAVYQQNGQKSQTANSNGLRIDVIDNNGAGAVIGTHTFSDVDFDTEAGPLSLGMSADSFTYTGSGNGDVKLVITGLGSGVFNGTIDDISVSEVPEPGSLALMGLGGLCILRRRRG